MSTYTSGWSLVVLLFLMLTGCETHTPDVLPPEGEELTEVKLHARFVSVITTVTTRSNYEDRTAVDGYKVGTFGTKGSWEAAHLKNIPLTYHPAQSPNLVAEQEKIYFPVQGNRMTLYAYAPYTATSSSAWYADRKMLKVRSELVSEEVKGVTDPLWAAPVAVQKSTTNGVVEAGMTFSHCMAKLKIAVYLPEGATSCLLNAIKVSFYHEQCGTMNIETGELLAANTGETSYTDTYETSELTASATPPATSQYEHTILPAQAVSTSSCVKTIHVTIDGAEYLVYDAEAEGTTPIKPEAGKVTRVNVCFNPRTQASAIMNGWGVDEENINI